MKLRDLHTIKCNFQWMHTIHNVMLHIWLQLKLHDVCAAYTTIHDSTYKFYMLMLVSAYTTILAIYASRESDFTSEMISK